MSIFDRLLDAATVAVEMGKGAKEGTKRVCKTANDRYVELRNEDQRVVTNTCRCELSEYAAAIGIMLQRRSNLSEDEVATITRNLQGRIDELTE